ncbi:MAG: hypothetical protein R3293_08535 [Candidatus Promineifilaceae bacterium]|nr:hypothetical protein [Candidatus Promineifilaceae bacterium]
MSPQPDFQLSSSPSTWFIKPDASRDFALTVFPFEGYANSVRLSVSGLPPGVTAEWNPVEIVPGQSAVVTLTSNGASLGKTVIKVSGASGDINHSQDVVLDVVEQFHEMWMPVFYRAR